MATKKTKFTNPIVTPAAAPVVRPATPALRSEVKGSGSPSKPLSREITPGQIAKRAYEIYASRGYAAGNPDEDWHEAERQLRAGL
ncbi:MAG: DUF2934 domain-containing protein [Phycisphaerae bacterium]